MGALVLRDIAAKLGITHSNVQYYFRTTEDLLLATFRREVASYIDAERSSVDAAAHPRDQVAAIVESGVEQLLRPQTALWRMALSLADHHAEMAAVLSEVNAEYRRAVEDDLARIGPQLTAERRADLARVVQAFQDGLAFQIVVDGMSPDRVRAASTAMVDALVGLVLPPD